MKKKISHKVPGITLNELLVVLVIIGILVLLALPKLLPLISKARGKEAELQLSHLQMLEKTYFYERSKYSDSFEEIGFEHEKLVSDGGNANYKIEIVEVSASGFKARATAIVDFDGDGVFNTWEIDQEKNLVEVTKD